MTSTQTLIIVGGGLMAIVGGLARLAWKWIVAIGLLIAGFGLLNLVFNWVR